MAASHFSGPVYSANGFVGALTVPAVAAVTGSTRTVTSADAGATLILDRAAGIAVTLPAATGTGNEYRFLVKTAVTSNTTTIKVANATDVMTGRAYVISDNSAAVVGYATASSSDTITFDGSTTGGLAGDQVVIRDVASGLFSVVVNSAATGTEATPFSATVS